MVAEKLGRYWRLVTGADSWMGLRSPSPEATLVGWATPPCVACPVTVEEAVVATTGSLALASRFQSQAAAGCAANVTAAKVVAITIFFMAGLLFEASLFYHD
jgi:hypothetical protein